MISGTQKNIQKEIMRSLSVFILLMNVTTYSFTQCLSGDCEDGQGVLKFKSGTVYIGEFSGGEFDGTGIMISANGDRFFGKWKDDMRTGYGKLLIGGGEQRYEGEFRNNKFEGYGTFQYRDKSIYTGMWESSSVNGPGRFRTSGGDIVEGIWQNGNLTHRQDITELMKGKSKKLRDCNLSNCNSGIGIFNYPDGSRWEGNMRNGKPTRLGVCYYSNGDIYLGEWLDDRPQGYGVFYYNDGKKIESFWEAGKAVQLTEPQIPESPITQTQFDKQVKIYSVIIGIGRYPDLPMLKYTDDDAYLLYSFLKSPEGGAVPDDQVKILIDEAANRENIIKTLKTTFAEADANDVILLYFAGHGINGYYLPFDSDGYKNRISYDEIKRILESSQAKHKLCIADACYSGSLLAQRSAFGESLDLFYSTFEKTKGGTAFLLSSKQEETSLESTGMRQGIFSHYLINGLKGASDSNKDRIITIKELYDYISYQVKKSTAFAQNPVIAGNYDNNMPVGVVRER